MGFNFSKSVCTIFCVFTVLGLMAPNTQAEEGKPEIVNDTFNFSPGEKKQTLIFSRSRRYGDWILSCMAKRDGSNETCTITQEVRTSQGALLIEARITRAEEDGQLMANFILPFGLHIPSGVWLETEDNKRYPIRLITCLENGFRGQLLIDARLREALSHGTKAFIVIFTQDTQKRMPLPLSLNGSQSAFSSIL